MLEKNKTYKMVIDDLGSEGQGVGRVDNFTVFVEGAVPGDYVEALIIKVKKSYAAGKAVKIIKASKDRVEAVCPVFSKCGGCHLQNLSYESQLAYKKNKVYNDLKRIGGIEADVFDVIGMDYPYYYRNKAQFPVQGRGGQPVIGFYRKRSHDIIEIKECFIHNKISSQITDVVKKFMIKHNIEPYDEKTNKGTVRHILVRTGLNEIMVCLVINDKNLNHKNELVNELIKIDGMKSILININEKQTNVIMGRQTKLLWGKEYIIDMIGNLKFKISALSFFQVNTAQTNILYQTVLEFADLKGTETVVDAYCGVGSISLFLAPSAKLVYGVDIIEEAIEDAKKNAKLNGAQNVEFILGDTKKVLQENILGTGISPDIIVVDPPRKGCEPEVIEAILEISPNKLIYVSCDPSTLARDLSLLSEKYNVKKVQPVDSFCQTYHVETAVLMQRV
ncbi:MAG: 23S rRNA (uracil(1939)-C(5))-methyltransferase RlmD [Clostridiales bacterium]|jgi:23S rRNA (uracil1939-C5)-methyltransferase|nr:23S rRNA (uracil(1939)-C(5))-methyltransferase RlmD [Clostridiales bacterium]